MHDVARDGQLELKENLICIFKYLVNVDACYKHRIKSISIVHGRLHIYLPVAKGTPQWHIRTLVPWLPPHVTRFLFSRCHDAKMTFCERQYLKINIWFYQPEQHGVTKLLWLGISEMRSRIIVQSSYEKR